MGSAIRRIAVNTGGGDAPGLNAVIRAVALAGIRRGWEVVGIRNGYDGLWSGPDGLILLNAARVSGITHLGGTILGANSRGNPFREPDGGGGTVDRSAELMDRLRDARIDALVAIGGDGSLGIARDLHATYGLQVVGVPKTIDNDLRCTDYTFGFDTAVSTATDALDKLHPTAQAHQRVMVVELMGRHAGWIALHAGLAGTADVILIPEIPFELESVYAKIRARYDSGERFAIVVVAEGAAPAGGERSVLEDRGPGREVRLGGIGERLAGLIQTHTGCETRALVLGHLQRGGQPTAFDRLLSLRFGNAAVERLAQGAFGTMVALTGSRLSVVSLEEATREVRRIPLDSDLLGTARDLGTCLGE